MFTFITAPTGQLSLTATYTSAISVPPPSMLKGKSIEEIINRWSTDLEGHVRDFNKFATEVAVWDRALIENGNNVGFHVNVPQRSFDMIPSCSSRLCIAMFWPPNESKMILISRWITSNNRKRSSPPRLRCMKNKWQISSVVKAELYGRWILALPTLSETKSRCLLSSMSRVC
jgi:hypothetical protein